MIGLGFKHCTQAWFYVGGQAWWLVLAQISLQLAHFNLLPEKHLTPWHREAWGRFPKVRTSRLDHGRTGHSENEIGFFQEFLMQNDFLHAYYLGFDWSGWIALIKSKILITKGMSWPGISDKWKAPWVNSWHFAAHWFPVNYAWGMSTEIPYWGCVTSQIWVETCHQYGISALVPWPGNIFVFP